MMDTISCLADFFNYSPKRQKWLKTHVMNYCDETTKTKLVPLCRTCWVERLNALKVTLVLAPAVLETFTDMVENSDKQWNRDTMTQASALLKRFDFESVINLVITQKVLACTSSITTRLQSQGFDMMKSVQIGPTHH